MRRTHVSLYNLVSYLTVAVGVVLTGYSYLQDRRASGG